ncbi:hypothetical protein LSH36_566g00071 [Paralvinella palmiformis]|uniref:CRAL-TRIO domain-containing protein n=1 Tax=Paralvinella palmiformis TaxID=53620 RepID=A0AAD9MY12_9ANNE|nr:hypothetical protein LSH36_566g00071 [Paralvinella palmiformis]
MSMWTKTLDTEADEINEIIDTGIILLLPDRDNDSHRVVLFKPGNIDPGNKILFTAFIRLFVIISYYNFFCDEMTQVHGIAFVSDWMGHTIANEMKIPLDFKRHMSTLLSILPEEYLPDDYNGPSPVSIKDMKDFLKAKIRDPKIRERIKYLSSEEFFINIKEKDTEVPSASFRKLNTD